MWVGCRFSKAWFHGSPRPSKGMVLVDDLDLTGEYIYICMYTYIIIQYQYVNHVSLIPFPLVLSGWIPRMVGYLDSPFLRVQSVKVGFWKNISSVIWYAMCDIMWIKKYMWPYKAIIILCSGMFYSKPCSSFSHPTFCPNPRPSLTRVWSKENASSHTIHLNALPSGRISSTTWATKCCKRLLGSSLVKRLKHIRSALQAILLNTVDLKPWKPKKTVSQEKDLRKIASNKKETFKMCKCYNQNNYLQVFKFFSSKSTCPNLPSISIG